MAWVVALLGMLAIGLFVALEGPGSLLLVLGWGLVLGALIVIPALVTWHARDSADPTTPEGRARIRLLRYAWPLGILSWTLARRARAVGILTGAAIAGAVLTLQPDWRTSAGATFGVLAGGIVVGAILGAVLTGARDAGRWVTRRPRR